MSNPPNPPFNFEQRPSDDPPPFSARVPERVTRGVYTTGQIVLDSPKEFVIDFLQGLTRPAQVAARVVITPQTMAELIATLHQNLDNYTRSFGPPPAINLPLNPPKPTLAEVYDNFKLPDEQLSGHYANSVLIGHSQTEFFFDFITSFYPTPAVSSRVLISAGQVPRFLQMLQRCHEQFKTKHAQPPEPPRDLG